MDQCSGKVRQVHAADGCLQAQERACTFKRVSCFSGSLSRCAETVPILTLKNLEVKASLKAKTSPSSTSLLIGSFRSTLRPYTGLQGQHGLQGAA